MDITNGEKKMSILDILGSIFFSFLEFFIIYLPGPAGIVLRYNYYKRKMKHLGRNVTIDEGVHIINPQCISIGENTWVDKHVILLAGVPSPNERKFFWKKNISNPNITGELIIGRGCHIAPNAVIQAHGGVKIGNYVGVASGAKIYSMSHHYRNLYEDDEVIYKFSPLAPNNEQFLIIGPVILKDNTCLGLNSLILPGTTIGKNSWVGVNSYVIENIPPNSIAIGSPAKVIKKRFK